MTILIFLIRLLMVVAVIYVIVTIYQAVKKVMNQFNNPMYPSEECPACRRRIQVSGDDMVCPQCGAKLGRTPDGKLIIRVN